MNKHAMNIKNIEDILPLVEQPSRYLGTEINRIRKDHDNISLRFALAFPDLYEIGTSHFGLQILYHILNRREDIAAERVFAPAPDMEAYLRQADIPLMSLESRTPLKKFDIIGFSLLYELNYTNILTILNLAKIPFFAADRDASYPLIIAGGPCTCNPEPVADFFDAIVIGDGEEVVLKLSDTWLEWKRHSANDKDALLRAWAEIEGVYVPNTSPPTGRKIKRTVISDLNAAVFPDAPVVPFGKPVHDRLRLELARGCTRGCRFCQAGMIYRPVRERSVENLLNLTHSCLLNTGYDDLSLLSLSTGDYTAIVPLMEAMMSRYEDQKVAVSLPSLRAGTLTPEMMQQIKRVRKTSFTIAPEAGSQRLRDVINKNVSHDDIVATVTDAFSLGWLLIKLYFMVGLPTETDEDLQAIVELSKELRTIKGPRNRKISVSLGTFVPKPHTPFQWASQLSLDDAGDRIHDLMRELEMPGIQCKWQNPKISLLEGLWGRGDRRLSKLLVSAWQKGCRFDGWSDHFQFRLWEEAFEEHGIDPVADITRARDLDEPLPWDHIEIVSKEFLKSEWQKALAGESTGDCRNGECNACGVCDFKQIAPKIYPPVSLSSAKREEKTGEFVKLKIFYSKRNDAKYLGHLEMVNVFLRAIQRAEIPIKFSQGFHPMPKVSFDDPLPIGIESEEEFFYVSAAASVPPETVTERLNAQLPEGLCVHLCRIADKEKERGQPLYRIILKDGVFDEQKLESFRSRAEFMFYRVNRKGNARDIDLKQAVSEIALISPTELHIVASIRPADIMKEIFGLSEEIIRSAEIVKCIKNSSSM
jgi:radical SAM family uncharacterized protein/radical SAM-linked protein